MSLFLIMIDYSSNSSIFFYEINNFHASLPLFRSNALSVLTTKVVAFFIDVLQERFRSCAVITDSINEEFCKFGDKIEINT